MMADDIDKILDQVESQLFSQNIRRYSNNLTSSSSSVLRSDVDPMVSALLDDLQPPSLSPASPSNFSDNNNLKVSPQNTKVPSSANKTKCFPLLLGSSESPLGLSTLQDQRTCDELLCTSCDRCVVAIPHSCWMPGIDPLFLRQAAVQPEQLQAKLEVQQGARAYACQCHSITITQNTQPMPPHLPWVCGKH